MGTFLVFWETGTRLNLVHLKARKSPEARPRFLENEECPHVFGVSSHLWYPARPFDLA